MIVMIMKSCSMQSFKDNYSGISAQLKGLEAVQVMRQISAGHAVRVFVQRFKS